MKDFESNLSSLPTDSFVKEESIERMLAGLAEFQDNTEDKSFVLDVSAANNAMCLGHDKFNTPFFLDWNRHSTTIPYIKQATSPLTNLSSQRRRAGYVSAIRDAHEITNKAMFIYPGYLGSDIPISPDPIEGPKGIKMLDTSPSPLSGFPVYIDVGDQQYHVGTLYNVADNSRIYLHHYGLFTGITIEEEAAITEHSSYRRRLDIEYYMFAMALDTVAWITNNIDDRRLCPSAFLEMSGATHLPGTTYEIDVLKRRRNTIEAELRSAETNLTDYQARAMEAASKLVSIRRLNAEMQTASSGIIDVRGIDHPLIKDIFVRKNAGEKILISTNEVFFKPSSNPEGFEYDEEEGVSCGHYLISISLEQEPNPIKFYNVDYRIKAYDATEMNHPHVFHEGNPCFGSFGNSISSALAEGNVGSVIDLVFLFLSQANQDDSAGRYWGRWLAHNEGDEGYECDPLEMLG